MSRGRGLPQGPPSSPWKPGLYSPLGAVQKAGQRSSMLHTATLSEKAEGEQFRCKKETGKPDPLSKDRRSAGSGDSHL